jgi:23S rRNA pseudouridine955/2504/2580 synthase
MSRRVKRPLRPKGDRPKGARPYRGSQAERPAHRPGSKPPARFSTSAPRAPKLAPFIPEPEKIVAEPPPLPESCPPFRRAR